LTQSLYNIIHAEKDETSILAGFGDQKTRKLADAFETPFKISE
jgi:hypothetical protein